MAKELSVTQATMMHRANKQHGICPGSDGVSTARSLVKRGLFRTPDRPGGVYYLSDAGKDWVADNPKEA